MKDPPKQSGGSFVCDSIYSSLGGANSSRLLFPQAQELTYLSLTLPQLQRHLPSGSLMAGVVTTAEAGRETAL